MTICAARPHAGCPRAGRERQRRPNSIASSSCFGWRNAFTLWLAQRRSEGYRAVNSSVSMSLPSCSRVRAYSSWTNHSLDSTHLSHSPLSGRCARWPRTHKSPLYLLSISRLPQCGPPSTSCSSAAPGGRVAYHGPKEDAIAHFANLDLPLPELWSPADHFIEIVSGEEPSDDTRRKFVADAWAARPPLPPPPIGIVLPATNRAASTLQYPLYSAGR